jgi:hypothetical protein
MRPGELLHPAAGGRKIPANGVHRKYIFSCTSSSLSIGLLDGSFCEDREPRFPHKRLFRCHIAENPWIVAARNGVTGERVLADPVQARIAIRPHQRCGYLGPGLAARSVSTQRIDFMLNF